MSNGYGQRKDTYSSRLTANPNDPILVAKDDILPRHEEYLNNLELRNRLIKQLKSKDNKQIELERKEQGFSLYLNGANAANRIKSEQLVNTHNTNKVKSDNHNLQHRAKSAPEKTRRKLWVAESLDIQTSRGEKIRVRAPDKYEDDFESLTETDSSCANSDEENEEMQPGNLQKSVTYIKPKATEIQNPSNIVTLSVAEVKELRKSLINSSVAESLRAPQSSDSDSNMDNGDDDIPEDVYISSSKDNLTVKSTNVGLKSTDMVVLEFAASPSKKMTNLHVQRKPDYAEANDSITASNNASNKKGESSARKGVSPTADIHIKPAQHIRHVKPQSVNKKVYEDGRSGSVETQNVLMAVQAENERLVQSRRNTQSAPCAQLDDLPSSRTSAITSLAWRDRLQATPTVSAQQQNTVAQPNGKLLPNVPNNTASMESSNSSGSSIDNLMQKVLQLDVKGQRKLMKALNLIEMGAAFSDDSSPNSTLEMEKPKTDNGRMVVLRILSSWGHKTRVGLTGIDLLDCHNERIQVSLASITIQGARNQQGDLSSLFDGKCKTIKERHMWSCDLPYQGQIDMIIQLPTLNEHLCQINIWNYNQSASTLNMGVRQAMIFLDSQLIFEGDIEKGCGNHVFDYSFKVCVPHNIRRKLTCSNCDSFKSVRDSNDLVRTESVQEHRKKERQQDNDIAEVSVGASAKADKHPAKSKSEIVQNVRPLPKPIKVVESIKVESETTAVEASHDKVKRSQRHDSRSSVQKASVAKSEKFEKLQIDVSDDVNHLRYSEGQLQSNNPSMSLLTDRSDRSQDSARARHRKTKHRRSKMVANLSGSSVSTSNNTVESVSTVKRNNSVVGKSTEEILNNEKLVQPTDLTGNAPTVEPIVNQTSTNVTDSLFWDGKDSKQKQLRETNTGHVSNSSPGSNKVLGGQDGKELDMRTSVSARNPKLKNPLLEDIIHQGKPSSPCHSDDESLMTQISKITKPQKEQPALPSWLGSDTELARPLIAPPQSRQEKRSEDKTLSANKSNGITTNKKTDDLTDLLDYLDNESPKTTRNQKTSPESHSDDIIDQLLREPGSQPGEIVKTPRMKQIEANRAQWRKKEEMQLEESWTSLNIFNRSQRGRLSMEIEDDALDEYLKLNRSRTMEPRIPEEPEPNELTSKKPAVDSFQIPELPVGQELNIKLLTTWGDKHYIGLNGIEIFTSLGSLAPIKKISANPADINVLPEYTRDPRVVTNLIDGVNRTRDDIHMWLAPFSAGEDHTISIVFQQPVQIAMMRIWNYNKSRIHSFRGAKDIEMRLDGRLVFVGEIARANGDVTGGTDSFGDTILFTVDEDILEAVANNDSAFEAECINEFLDDDELLERPKTANKGSSETRPFTAAEHPVPTATDTRIVRAESDSMLTESCLAYRAKCIKINFVATWGDPYYLGLTGLEVVGPDGDAIKLNMNMVSADPRDLHVLPGHDKDTRTLEKLIDGTNVTNSDDHMWLIPFTAGEDHLLTITFPTVMQVTGLRLWNYNKSAEDTYRGAKIAHVSIDGVPISPPEGYLIRKGPGNVFFDFAQEINFIESRNIIPKNVAGVQPVKKNINIAEDSSTQEYEAPKMPRGFIYQFHLLSTWGDPYYVGLNGLAFFDENGSKIQLTENNISAYPDSVNVLDGVKGDTRTPDKLIDGTNESSDGQHAWLAPILPTIINRIFVIFDTPVQVSMIQLWNYSKTPNRGVKDFAVLVDDLLVYNGTLDMVPLAARGILPTCAGSQRHHTILFTVDGDLYQQEKHSIIRNQAGEQDVQLLNDRKVVAQYQNNRKDVNPNKPVDQALRPSTSVPKNKRY